MRRATVSRLYDYNSNRRLVRWRKKMVTIMNSFSWKLVVKSTIIFKLLINVSKYLLMIYSCHNWQNKRKATDVRWRRKICDQVTALHTGIIDHLFLIFSFKICIAPPVLTKNWYICTFTIPNTEISRIFDQSERCWLVLFFFDMILNTHSVLSVAKFILEFGIWNCVVKCSKVTFHCWSKE